MATKNNTKYGLFVVKCMNVGDDIQSLAALRFIPGIDYYVDRDRLDKVNEITLKKNQELKVIMNGWYLGGYQYWPPSNNMLKPLLTSIHINPLHDQGAALKKFTSRESIAFLRKFSPVGSRDMFTYRLLKKHGVNTYFSGCMTLTLNADERVKRKDFILAVNVSDAVYDAIKQKTHRKVVRMDVERTQDTTIEENLALARYYLYMYQSAHCVVTTRLHATLPTVAVGGKALFIIEKNGDNIDFKDRFNGLFDLVNNMTAEEFINDVKSIQYDINKPPKNPDEYKKLRKELEKISTKYTGFDSGKSYMGSLTIEELVTSAEFFSAITKISEESWDSFKFKHKWAIPPILYEELKGSEQQKKQLEELRNLLSNERQPGIITSIKRLVKAILFKVKVLKRN